MKKQRKKQQIISVFVCLNLIFSQSFFAANLPITPDNTKSPNLFIDQTANKVDIANIEAPINSVSHNVFKDFNINENGLIFNNSNSITSTKLGGVIYKNPNFSSHEANTIIAEISGTNKTHLLGFGEIAGKKADLIIANPNGIIANKAGFINTNNISFDTRSQDNSAKFEVLGEGIDLTNTNKAEILANLVELNAAIYGGNELQIKLENSSNLASNLEPQYALDAKAFGSMYARKIKIIANNAGIGVRSNADIIAQDELIINSNGDLELRNVKAKNIELKAKGNIGIGGEIFANKNINLSSKENINLQGITKLQIKTNFDKNDIENSKAQKITKENQTLNLQTTIQKAQINAKNINLKAKQINIKNADLLAKDEINLKAKTINHKSDKEILYSYDKTTITKLSNNGENHNFQDFLYTKFDKTIDENLNYDENLVLSQIKAKKINYKTNELNLESINLQKNVKINAKNVNNTSLNTINLQTQKKDKVKFDLNSGEYLNTAQSEQEIFTTKELLQIYKNNSNLINDLQNIDLNLIQKQITLNSLSNLLLNSQDKNIDSVEVRLLNTSENGADGVAFKGNFNQALPNSIFLNLKNINTQNDLIFTLTHELMHLLDNANGSFLPNSAYNESTANAYANLNKNAFNIISNLQTGQNSKELNLNYDASNLSNLQTLNFNNKEFTNLDKNKGSNHPVIVVPVWITAQEIAMTYGIAAAISFVLFKTKDYIDYQDLMLWVEADNFRPEIIFNYFNISGYDDELEKIIDEIKELKKSSKDYFQIGADKLGLYIENAKNKYSFSYENSENNGGNYEYGQNNYWNDNIYFSNSDKRLSDGEIDKLKNAGINPHDLKPHSDYDLFKDKQGNIYVKPKDGRGSGEPTGYNINDF